MSEAAAASKALASLLLDCVRGEADRIPGAVATCPPAALAQLPQVAEFHGVEVPVRRALAGVDVPDPSVVETLDRMGIERAATTLRLQAELKRLRDTLDGEDVRWAVLKGPILADVYYRESGRSFEDLDVLVEPRQLDAVLEVLSHTADLVDRNWTLIRASRRGEVTVALPAGSALDLHWHLLTEARVRRRFLVSTTDLLDRAVRVATGAGEVPTLDPVDTLLHVGAHACLSGGHRLQWSMDVKAVVESGQVAWSEVVRRGRRTGLALPVGIMLARARAMLGLDLPPLLLDELGGGTSWARAVRALHRSRSLPQVRKHVLSGHTAMASTRDTSLASTTALMQAASGHLVTRLRPPPQGTVNPLHHEDGAASDRTAFLAAAVAEEAQTYAASRA